MCPLPRPVLWLVLLVFGLFTAYVVAQVGVLGIFQGALGHLGATQVLVDLVVMAGLLLALLWRDARARGRCFWPWALLTLAVGSFGPLIYWLLGDRRPPPG